MAGRASRLRATLMGGRASSEEEGDEQEQEEAQQMEVTGASEAGLEATPHGGFVEAPLAAAAAVGSARQQAAPAAASRQLPDLLAKPTVVSADVLTGLLRASAAAVARDAAALVQVGHHACLGFFLT